MLRRSSFALISMLIGLSMPALASAGEKPASPDFSRQVAQSDAGLIHSGTVIETLSTAGYIYVLAEGQGGRIWIAAPAREVRAGMQVRWGEGVEMKDFQSKTLGRMFHSVVFVDRIDVR